MKNMKTLVFAALLASY